MAQSISLLDFLLKLISDDELREDFAADPDGTLADYNLNDLSAQDVHDALLLAQDSHQASFDRSYDTGFHGFGNVPPVPAHAGHADGGHGHKEAVEYINNYITNNYVDDRDTIVDNSVNQNIDNRGGIFDQDIDIDSVVASGDGAVAAGDDIDDSNIVTGNGNVAGNGNDVVNGDGNTTAFGNGNATSLGDVSVDDGSAFSVNGDATVNDNDTDIDVRSFGEGDTTVAAAGAGSTVNQVSNHSEVTQTSTVDSNDTTNVDVDIEDSFNTETDVDIASNNHVLSDNEVLSDNQGGTGTGADGVDI